MTMTNLLLALTAILLGLSNLATLYLLNETNSKWMRMFSAHSLGMSVASMEGKAERPKTELKKDTRQRLSVPVPMGGVQRSS